MVVGAALGRVLVQQWPRIKRAWELVGPYVAANPHLPRQVADRFAVVGRQLHAAQRRRGDAEKIRAMLATVRELATELREHDDAVTSEAAAAWLHRATTVERSVRLAEAQDPARRKKSLARLRSETDALVADVLEAMTTSPAPPGTAP